MPAYSDTKLKLNKHNKQLNRSIGVRRHFGSSSFPHPPPPPPKATMSAHLPTHPPPPPPKAPTLRSFANPPPMVLRRPSNWMGSPMSNKAAAPPLPSADAPWSNWTGLSTPNMAKAVVPDRVPPTGVQCTLSVWSNAKVCLDQVPQVLSTKPYPARATTAAPDIILKCYRSCRRPFNFKASCMLLVRLLGDP